MNFSKLKKIYEALPYIFKLPLSGVLRKKLISNHLFLIYYNKLNSFDSLSQDYIKDEQFLQLKKTLIHAYEHTKYYKSLFDNVAFNPYEFNIISDINKIPVLTKRILQDHFDELIADDAGNGYMVTTGGTSGKPTKVIMSNNAYYIEWAFVYHFWSKYGYDIKKSKLATFRGIKLGNKISEINPMYREIRMNIFRMNKLNIKKYFKRIERYGVEFLYGYPSAIFTFCKLANAAGIELKRKFKAVFLISENLYPFQEECFSKILECPIGMFYGHSERAVFAEKENDSYFFNSLYGYTEINEKNEPVVTGFINQKMPLIRYVVDDRVTKKENGFLIEGHHDCEVLLGVNGEEISAASINFHDNTFQKIDTYQFKQKNAGHCVLLLKPSLKLSEDDLQAILKSVKSKFGSVLTCELKVVDDVFVTERGKFKMIIHE